MKREPSLCDYHHSRGFPVRTFSQMYEAFEHECEDGTFIRAWIDCYEEQSHEPHRDCVRIALKLRRTVRRARDLADAAQLIRIDRPGWITLRESIRRMTSLHLNTAFTVVLLEGNSRPCPLPNWHERNTGWWLEMTVTVGAKWILREHARLTSLEYHCPPLPGNR